MKKGILALSILLLTVAAYAQESKTTNGRRGGGGNPHMKEALTQQLVKELQLTDSQVDSVVSIQFDFQRDMRETKQNINITESDKEAKITEMKVARNNKLRAVLSAAQVEKLQAVIEEMRKTRQQQQPTETKE